MQTTIVKSPAFKVVGIRVRVMAMSAEIPALWGRFVPRSAEVQNPAEPDVAYGLMGNFDEATRMLDYMAGISVTATAEIPEGMEAWEVPAATCAVFETNLATIHETYSRIDDEWLPGAGYSQAPGVAFERFDETFKPDAGRTTFSIFIPVAPKS
jgi:AraC family transcriptional regulator